MDTVLLFDHFLMYYIKGVFKSALVVCLFIQHIYVKKETKIIMK